MNLSDYVQVIHHMNAVVAGTTNQNGAAWIDMQGYDGVMFIADLGALSATQVTKLQAQGANDSSGGGSSAFTTDAVTPAMADGDSNKCLVLDVFRPTKRFVRATVQRGTANAVIDCVIAILYQADKKPVVDGT